MCHPEGDQLQQGQSGSLDLCSPLDSSSTRNSSPGQLQGWLPVELLAQLAPRELREAAVTALAALEPCPVVRIAPQSPALVVALSWHCTSRELGAQSDVPTVQHLKTPHPIRYYLKYSDLWDCSHLQSGVS